MSHVGPVPLVLSVTFSAVNIFIQQRLLGGDGREIQMLQNECTAISPGVYAWGTETTFVGFASC